jgi:hypothetical protein
VRLGTHVPQERREFHEALLEADTFEDLPGKWQAAWAQEVSFEFPPDVDTIKAEWTKAWQRARKFLADMLEELHKPFFSS